MANAISIVTLLTDFGTRDYFVASMKGVLLNINSQARIIDLTHEITPHNVEEAAYLLKSSYRYFPDGTIHVAVVDPGVGTSRRPLLVTTSRYFFLAPDNGLLTSIIKDELSVEVRAIENRQYRLDSEGVTFDGRDLFAPAAAWLTRGQMPGSYGRIIGDYHRLPLSEPAVSYGVLKGRIVYVDRFGNLMTDITPFHLRELQGATRRSEFQVRIAQLTIDGIVSTYAEGDPHHPRALINSNGNLEIFLKEGSAASLLGIGVGALIEVT
jgi:S-adenosylmethionine hydrolase